MKTNIGKRNILILKGTYTGNDAENRPIPHGIGGVPTIVLLLAETARMGWIFGDDPTYLIGNAGAYVVTAMDATNFYVGDAASYLNSFNNNLSNYCWVAIK